MRTWRDDLAELNRFERDEATGELKANGQLLTRGEVFTPYGQDYFRNELRGLEQALAGVDEEISFINGLIERDGDDPEERAVLDQLLAKAQTDRGHVLAYRTSAEAYFVKFANPANAMEAAE